MYSVRYDISSVLLLCPFQDLCVCVCVCLFVYLLCACAIGYSICGRIRNSSVSLSHFTAYVCMHCVCTCVCVSVCVYIISVYVISSIIFSFFLSVNVRCSIHKWLLASLFCLLVRNGPRTMYPFDYTDRVYIYTLIKFILFPLSYYTGFFWLTL